MATSRIQFAQDEVKIQCDMCDSFDTVNSFCRECSFKICDSCIKSHFRLNKSHTVVPVFEEILQKRYIVKCSKHDDKFKFFCKVCGENICEECITSDHMDHKVEKFSNLPVCTPNSFTKESDLLGSLNSLPPTKRYIVFETLGYSSLSTLKSAPADPSMGVTTSLVSNNTTCRSPSLKQQLHVICKLSPTGYAVLSICAADDGMLWVGTVEWLLLLINEKGEEQKKVDMPGSPYYTCTTRSGDALVSTGGGKSIYKVTKQGQVSTFVDVSPGHVYGITVTQDGDVFACVESGSVYNIKKFSSEGKFVLALESAMFTFSKSLYRVHAVSGDMVCIQDGNPGRDKVCYLVIVTAAGQVVSRVTRTGKLNENTKDIVWDKYGNMMTGKGEYINVFSGEGTCRQSYKVEGCSGVRALCLGKGGVLWIGTRSGEVITAKNIQ